MSFNINLPLGRSGAMSGLTGVRLTSKDPKDLTAVVYDTEDRVATATYLLVDDTTETISISYTAEGWLVYNGLEYRNYQYDLFSAEIIPLDSLATAQAKLDTQAQEDEKLCLLREIKEELNKTNAYFAVITDVRI